MTGEIKYLSEWAKQTFHYAVTGIFVGLIIAGFFICMDLFSSLFLQYLGGYIPPSPRYERHFFYFSPLSGPVHTWLPLPLAFIPALGGLIAGVLKYKLFRVAKPELHETDVFIDGFHNENGRIKAREGLIRGICSALTIGSGGSAGREGPSAMLGATVGSLFSRLFKLDARERRKILAAAAGAGIAAIFKSPLGGAFFGIETLYRRDMEVDALVPAIICSITSYIVACSLFGHGHLYEIGTYDITILLKPFSLLLFLALGIACIPFVYMFIKLLEIIRTFFFGKLRMPDCFKPALGGFIIGVLLLIGCFVAGRDTDTELEIASGILGGGYGFIQEAFYGRLTLTVLAFIAVAKIIATAVTLGSGGSGGSFIPSLAMGASLGGAIGLVLNYFFPETVRYPWVFALIGAAAFFGAAANAPLTALFIVCEISGSYTLFVPALLAIIPAYSLVGRRTIYPGQYETRRESPAHKREFMVDLLEGIKVKDAYTKGVLTIPGDNTVKEALYFAERTGHIAYPVIDREGRMIGITTIMELEEEREKGFAYKRVSQMCTRDVIVAYPEEYLEDVLYKMDRYNIGRLPVVEPGEGGERRLIGIISRSDIIREHCRRRSLLRSSSE